MKSSVFSRALLKAQAIAMLIACVNINRKVDMNLNCIQEETSETQFNFSDKQKLSESTSI